ncbi:hypothetical protein [Gramella sp. AN32]|uniref:Lipocalin-like domain-containing protein n=1 Tax=Christiangramia antarctica TaxID=2058158 RepID=A0ABW5X8V1_9FLAO|nr:hypothetical protein [Gramella sp. AN32]MCM4158228.1 hypothetical protein [Gramella sp. AN32]
MRKLILLLIISIFASCSKNDDSIIQEENIIGAWENLQTISNEQVESGGDVNLFIRQELTFLNDGTFDWLFSIENSDNGDNLGYIMRQTGEFQINENSLIVEFDRYQSERDAESNKYNPILLSNLVLVDENINADYSIVLNNNNNTLLFDFPSCNNNQNTTCPADMEFTRFE